MAQSVRDLTEKIDMTIAERQRALLDTIPTSHLRLLKASLHEGPAAVRAFARAHLSDDQRRQFAQYIWTPLWGLAIP